MAVAAKSGGARRGPPAAVRGAASGYDRAAMATFSVRFLGCKVSHADAQKIRERPIAGHEERRAADGAEDLVLVDRPGRGHGDDYSPWLVEAPVGALVRVRGVGVAEEGIVGARA